jgi:ABC-type phosphate transport system substrate-binding protein
MKTIAFALVMIALASGMTQAQVAVIAHPSVEETSITRSAVTDIYSLTNTMWSNRSAVIVVDVRSDIPAKKQFYSEIGKSPSDLRKVWMRAVLSGEAKAPEVAESEEEVLQKVSSTRGAIGYVSASKVTAAVKVLARFD